MTATSLLLLGLLAASPSVPTPFASAPSYGATVTQTDRLREVMQGSTGVPGFYVKQVGGDVLAAYNHNRVFEPASSIKVIAHLYALRRYEQGSLDLAKQIPRYGDEGSPGQCGNNSTDSMERALKLMMENSDNNRTRAVVDRLGRANINLMMAGLGFAKTRWVRPMPCEVQTQDDTIENAMTLAEGGRMYERVVNGTYFEQSATREKFWDLMAGHSLGTTLGEELQRFVPSSTARAAYMTHVRGASKGGWWPNKGRGSELGWIRLPWCVGGNVVTRDYVYGFFVDDGQPDDGDDAVAQATWRARAEIMREQFVGSARSWEGCS